MRINKTSLAICIGALCILTVWPKGNTQAFQDLDRINNIVNQARGLADSVRQGGGVSTPQAAATSQWSNPFSANGSGVVSSLAVPATANPTVEVNGADINIMAGGHSFSVPRIANGVAVGPGVLGSSSPSVNLAAASNAVQQAQQWRNFATAVQSFRGAEFSNAANLMSQINPTPSRSPALDQFHSLCSFASGQYQQSAEYAYAALAQNQSVYDWNQIRGYYRDSNDYAKQYRALQLKAAEPEADESVQFLLGYHHLMLGHRQQSAKLFMQVLSRMPQDPVVKQVLSISQQAPPVPLQPSR